MTNPDDNNILSSCMFARVGNNKSQSGVWGQVEDVVPARRWEMQSAQTPVEVKVKNRQVRASKRKPSPSYKHVPHREKPPQLVARRNARERRRVQAVNVAFSRLRKVVPIDNNRGKRVSKVKTLHKAIEYISQLQGLLVQAGPPSDMLSEIPSNTDLNKENSGEASNRWGVYDVCSRAPALGTDSLVQLLQDFHEHF